MPTMILPRNKAAWADQVRMAEERVASVRRELAEAERTVERRKAVMAILDSGDAVVFDNRQGEWIAADDYYGDDSH